MLDEVYQPDVSLLLIKSVLSCVHCDLQVRYHFICMLVCIKNNSKYLCVCLCRCDSGGDCECLCVCLCVSVCLCVCVYVCMCVCVCLCVCLDVTLVVTVGVCVSVCVSLYVCVCMSVCLSRCDSGGDCECLCTAVAAFASECDRHGVYVKWRHQHFCRTLRYAIVYVRQVDNQNHSQ